VVLWWHAWAGHLGTTLTCACGDSGQEVWFVAWPAYALAHGHNLFFSSALNAPAGTNLLVNTSAPLVGTVLAPVTWIFGPVVATNVALTLTPALGAWACFVACRRFTSWWPAAALAGLLFGYSPFVVDNLATGHVSVALLVTPPLMLMVAHQLLVTQRGRPWRPGVALALLLAVQYLISIEILAVTVLVGAVGVVTWAVVAPRTVVRRLPFAAEGLAWTAVVAAVLLAVPLWLTLAGPEHVSGSPWPGIQLQGNRLADLWNPGPYALAANGITRLAGYQGRGGPTSAYLGLGVLALAVGSVVVAWRRRLARICAVLAAVSVSFSLGAVYWEAGTRFVSGPWLPWRTIGMLPLLDRIGPQRFSALTALFVAVLIALGLDEGRRRLVRAWAGASAGRPVARHARARTAPRARRDGVPALLSGALVAVAVLALVPIWRTYQVPLATTSVDEPAWFAAAGRTLSPGSVVLAYPFPTPSAGDSAAMVWQAEDDMRFSLAGGYAKVPGPQGTPLNAGPPGSVTRILAGLSTTAGGPLPTGSSAQIATLRGALERWHVTDVVVTDDGRDPAWAATLFTAVTTVVPTISHRAWVWHLDAGAVARAGAAVGPGAAAAALAACPPVPGASRALKLDRAGCVAVNLPLAAPAS